MTKDQIRKKAKEKRSECRLSKDVQDNFKMNLNSVLNELQIKQPVYAGYDAIQTELNLSFLKLNYLIPQIDKSTRVLGFEYSPDVFFIPLLAFDDNGYRIGYGGGYYDATLLHYRSEKKVIAIGVGYEAQKWETSLFLEDHDERLDYMVTEEKIRRFC